MLKKAIGTIPEKISYVYSGNENVFIGSYWDYNEYDDKGLKTNVTPTYPVGSDKDSDLIAAKKWAKNNRTSKSSIKVDVKNNEPLTKIKIISLDVRSQGGRAYKVIIDDKYYVDMREDVVVEAIISVGVSAGGILNGSYIWVKLGSQMRLVRVDSALYEAINESNKLKELKPIPKDELEIGGIYEDRRGEVAVFLGLVNTVKYDISDKYFSYKTKKNNKAMLFYECYSLSKIGTELQKDLKENSLFSFKIHKTHHYLKKIKNISLAKKTDYVKVIRDKSRTNIKNSILEYTGHKPAQSGYSRIDQRGLNGDIIFNSELLNMYKCDDTDADVFDPKMYIIFS